jgi:hypothetical protein
MIKIYKKHQCSEPNSAPRLTEVAWMDDNWAYRQTVAITNAGTAQTDFQVAITLDTAALITAGKMQSDCDDIRITDLPRSDREAIYYWGVSGKVLPYWIETNNINYKLTHLV